MVQKRADIDTVSKTMAGTLRRPFPRYSSHDEKVSLRNKLEQQFQIGELEQASAAFVKQASDTLTSNAKANKKSLEKLLDIKAEFSSIKANGCAAGLKSKLLEDMDILTDSIERIYVKSDISEEDDIRVITQPIQRMNLTLGKKGICIGPLLALKNSPSVMLPKHSSDCSNLLKAMNGSLADVKVGQAKAYTFSGISSSSGECSYVNAAYHGKDQNMPSITVAKKVSSIAHEDESPQLNGPSTYQYRTELTRISKNVDAGDIQIVYQSLPLLEEILTVARLEYANKNDSNRVKPVKGRLEEKTPTMPRWDHNNKIVVFYEPSNSTKKSLLNNKTAVQLATYRASENTTPNNNSKSDSPLKANLTEKIFLNSRSKELLHFLQAFYSPVFDVKNDRPMGVWLTTEPGGEIRMTQAIVATSGGNWKLLIENLGLITSYQFESYKAMRDTFDCHLAGLACDKDVCIDRGYRCF